MPDLIWQKSSFSGSGQDDCVEIAVTPGKLINLRESDRPDTVLNLPPATLRALLAHTRNGRLDRDDLVTKPGVGMRSHSR
ncbi:DUF397 domain-containing protein [Streptomyces sp. NPDC002537]